MKTRDLTLTAIDFETTGAVRGHPDIPWQIGLVEIAGGCVTGRHAETLLHVPADRPFNPYAPGRHAALRAPLAIAPEPALCWPAWAPWLTSRPLVAHNAATEKKILRRLAPLHTFGPWIDTLRLARHLLPAAADYTLSAVCTALNLLPRLEALCPSRTWHDALYDAFASALLLETALAHPAWRDLPLETLAALPPA